MTFRIFLPVALAISTATAGHAGGLAATVTEAVVVEEAPTVSSGSNLVVPLILLALIALAASASNDNGSSGGTGNSGFSDMRLKTDILKIGRSPSGLNIYQFRYIGQSQLYQGVMAQEVQQLVPSAVGTGMFGFYTVDYSQIDVRMLPIN